jgi:hypothetical protein
MEQEQPGWRPRFIRQIPNWQMTEQGRSWGFGNFMRNGGGGLKLEGRIRMPGLAWLEGA